MNFKLNVKIIQTLYKKGFKIRHSFRFVNLLFEAIKKEDVLVDDAIVLVVLSVDDRGGLPLVFSHGKPIDANATIRAEVSLIRCFAGLPLLFPLAFCCCAKVTELRTLEQKSYKHLCVSRLMFKCP